MIKNIVGACIRVCHWTYHSSRIISFNYKLCFLLDLGKTPSRWFSGENKAFQIAHGAGSFVLDAVALKMAETI